MWNNPSLSNSLDDVFVVGTAYVSNGAESIEVAVVDRGAWTQWVQLDMTTGVNALPTLSSNAANLNLNTWTLLLDVLGVNDTDGDTIQVIRFGEPGTDTLSYSLSKRAYLDSNVSYDLPSLKDVCVRGHTSFAEETIRVQLYDGYEWGEWTDVTMTSGTNVAPELRSVSDGSVIGGTLNTTIRTNERRALSEYISYCDDPNDDDNNLPTSVKVRTTGATGLGIEVDGVVTNLDSGVEQSFAVESLDDIFVVGNANVSNGVESIEVAVVDRGAWTQWVQLDMTTGANALATVTSSTTLTDMNLNQWYLLSDLITVNDADGDTIQSIRIESDAYGPSIDVYSVSQRGYLDGSNELHELPSRCDLEKVPPAFVEAQFTLELYDGIAWSTAENMSFTFGTNLAPELRSVSDNSVISGRLIPLSVPMNDVPLVSISSITIAQMMMTVAIRQVAVNINGVNGNINLGIEIDGVVTSISNMITGVNINSLNDVFIVGVTTASNNAESFEIERMDNAGASTGKVQADMTTGANALPTLSNNAESLQTMLKVKAENGKFILYKPDNTLFEEGFVKGNDYNIDISDSSLTHHPFKLSATADGTHTGGISLTNADGVTSSEIPWQLTYPKNLVLTNYIITVVTIQVWVVLLQYLTNLKCS